MSSRPLCAQNCTRFANGSSGLLRLTLDLMTLEPCFSRAPSVHFRFALDFSFLLDAMRLNPHALSAIFLALVTVTSADIATILAEFFAATDGPNWITKYGWPYGPPCSFYGVVCDSGRPLTINLDGNNLTGTIPDSLGEIASLRIFHLSKNHLRGTIPRGIANLTDLGLLQINDNELEGTIPAELSQRDSIFSLYLQNNRLTGTVPVLNSPAIAYVDLSNNQLSGTVPKMNDNINTLLLGKNRITGDLEFVRSLIRLARLDISDNAFRSLKAPDAMLPQLSYFAFASCDMNAPLEALLRFPRLQQILGDDNKITGTVPAALPRDLFELNLRNNAVGGTIPKNISAHFNMLRIDLANNSLTGTVPWMGTMIRLTYLDLSGNQLTALDAASFSGVTQLHYLSLARNRISATIPPAMAILPLLEFLDISHNKFFGSVPPLALPRLSVLLAHHNALEGILPSSLLFCGQYAIVDLSFNAFSEVSDDIALTNFTAALLHYNRISGTLPPIAATSMLFVRSNHLSCALPPRLPFRPNLTDIIAANAFSHPVPDWVTSAMEWDSPMLVASSQAAYVAATVSYTLLAILACSLLAVYLDRARATASAGAGDGNASPPASPRSGVRKPRRSVRLVCRDVSATNNLAKLLGVMTRLCPWLVAMGVMLNATYLTGATSFRCGRILSRLTAAYLGFTPAMWQAAVLMFFHMASAASLVLSLQFWLVDSERKKHRTEGRSGVRDRQSGQPTRATVTCDAFVVERDSPPTSPEQTTPELSSTSSTSSTGLATSVVPAAESMPEPMRERGESQSSTSSGGRAAAAAASETFGAKARRACLVAFACFSLFLVIVALVLVPLSAHVLVYTLAESLPGDNVLGAHPAFLGVYCHFISPLLLLVVNAMLPRVARTAGQPLMRTLHLDINYFEMYFSAALMVVNTLIIPAFWILVIDSQCPVQYWLHFWMPCSGQDTFVQGILKDLAPFVPDHLLSGYAASLSPCTPVESLHVWSDCSRRMVEVLHPLFLQMLLFSATLQSLWQFLLSVPPKSWDVASAQPFWARTVASLRQKRPSEHVAECILRWYMMIATGFLMPSILIAGALAIAASYLTYSYAHRLVIVMPTQETVLTVSLQPNFLAALSPALPLAYLFAIGFWGSNDLHAFTLMLLSPLGALAGGLGYAMARYWRHLKAEEKSYRKQAASEFRRAVATAAKKEMEEELGSPLLFPGSPPASPSNRSQSPENGDLP
eukprot:TRINITY_DN2800_c0_g1_i1.p1 TRINITY_DN2800_c0_g1~~TRINITY_DN2800_c0_g1_i1.p1  ORF type:complete len:1230 (-),score=177.05 TRINITY_DN2800_c0_g1_i1:2773-6462(-)